MRKFSTAQIVVVLIAIFVVLNVARYYYNVSKNNQQEYGNAIAESVEAND